MGEIRERVGRMGRADRVLQVKKKKNCVYIVSFGLLGLEL